MKVYSVIMAGGVGARFWPLSRKQTPKQLLKIFNDNSLIQDTVKRLKGIIKPSETFVITNEIQKEGIKKQLNNIPDENIISEPFGKNTAACIGLSSILIKAKSEDAIIVTLPADHQITNTKKFQKTIKKAINFAGENGALVTIGIKPTRAETGYGYIQIDDQVNDDVYRVKTFAEKPNIETAQRFVDSGDFYWNSGMFIWKATSILNEIKNLMPDLYEGLEKIEEHIGMDDFYEVLKTVYGQLRSISIDYGVMEKTSHVYLIKGEFDWSDVGSWDAVYELKKKDDDGNVLIGDIYSENSINSYINTNKKFTAVIGAQNLIVIETEDALLICDRYKAQDVKLVVDHLRMNKRNELL